MTRLMGAVLLALGCGAVGWGAVGRLERRVRDLRELAAGLDVLQRELGWRLAPLPAALDTAAKEAHGCAARFFEQCAQGAGRLNGRSFQQVWREELETCPLQLTAEDKQLLEQLGSVLGRYDGESQRKAIEEGVSRLDRQIVQAGEDRRRLGRVYGALGMTAGLFLAVLLI